MEQMLVVTLREGLEAFLIVAITIACLRKTGRAALLPAALWGTAAAVGLSIVLGTALAKFAVQPIWEGLLATIAAALIISMVLYMMRTARHLRSEISRKIEAAAQHSGAAARIGVFLFVLLMLTREGMEMAFITATLAGQTGSGELLAGAVLGIAAAAAMAWAWSRYGHRINLGLFFQVTSLFLLLFAVQLVIYGFHEFTEAGVFPLDNEYWHIATEPYGPEGQYGHWLSYALVMVPMAWLAFAAFKGRLANRTV